MECEKKASYLYTLHTTYISLVLATECNEKTKKYTIFCICITMKRTRSASKIKSTEIHFAKIICEKWCICDSISSAVQTK